MPPHRLPDRNAPPSAAWKCSALLGLLLVAAGLPLPGCGGCRKDRQAAPVKAAREKGDQDAKKKKEKPPYEVGRLEVVPSDDASMRNLVKPGHMVTATLPALCSIADFRADVEMEVTDTQGEPVPIGGTRYHLVMSRPVVLPKGQRKTLEFTFFIPQETGENSGLFLRHRLRHARGGNLVLSESEPASQMPNEQYLLVVLSTNPNAYGYLKRLDSVEPAFDEMVEAFEGGSALRYYRIALPTVKDRVPLPAHSFSWSSIAYVLWDGGFTDRMTPDQQRAMLNWLHWGGQLIVSGPDSLGHLAGSFLAPYLPAADDGAIPLTGPALQPLNDYWSLTEAKSGKRLALDVAASTPLIGVRLRPLEGSTVLQGTGELAVERRVGRGRIVVTAFSLSAPDVVNWGCFDSFFNNGLLRRPPRVFTTGQFGSVKTNWVSLASQQRNPLIVTATRYFTRDAGSWSSTPSSDGTDAEVDWHLDGCEAGRRGGVASWSDTSGPAVEAHRALQDAAGISIPQANFVLSVLIVYLIVLVPVNWALFRLWGRIEWAWVAAPVIAIGGAVAVIRLAQLDIGFVRSRTEIAVLEMQGGHADAHVTRYTALYSSLSTSYRLEFEGPSAIARPFPPTPSPSRLWPLTFRREEGVKLSGFQVDSNTTSFIHGEQMCELGGAIRLVGESAEQWSVENGTGLNLQSVQLLYRAPSGIQVCHLHTLPAGAASRLEFVPDTDGTFRGGAGQGGEGVDSPAGGGEVDLRGIADLAARAIRLRPGDVRLIARTDDLLPGLTIKPAASQVRIRTLVLVHLRYGPLPSPRPDVNLRVDVQRARSGSGETDELPESLEEIPGSREPQ